MVGEMKSGRAHGRLASLPASFVFGLVLFFAVRARASDGESNMLRDRFLREVPQAWQEYRSSVARLQGAGTLSQIDLLTGQTLERSSGEFRQRGDLSRRILQNLGPEMHDGHAYVRNANYAFELLRRDANSPWVIVGLIP